MAGTIGPGRRQAIRALAVGVWAMGLPAPVAIAAIRGRPLRVGGLRWGGDPAMEPQVREYWAKQMRALGYSPGKDLEFDWRSSGVDFARLHTLAAELVRRRPDALLGLPVVSVKALSEATASIPITGLVGDPVRQGYTGRIGRPTRNVTGVADSAPELIAKMAEMLKAMMPGLSRFAIVSPTRISGPRDVMRMFEEAVRNVGVEPVSILVSGRDELIAAFESMPGRGIAAAWHSYGSGFLDKDALAALALRHRVALGDFGRGIVAAGGLVSYSAVMDDLGTILAGQLDRLLRGTPVRDVPFHLPTKFLLEVNRKTAAALGLEIPRELLLRADRVYE
jgi:putative ABC transport system substrate-binding protein